VEVQDAKMTDFLLTGVLEAGSTDVHIAWLLCVRIFKCLAQALILLNLPSIILLLVKTLIMLMLFL